MCQQGIPCAIALGGKGHILTITYDVKTSSWTYINSGHIDKLLDEDTLARYIHRCLLPDRVFPLPTLCAISTHVFATKDKADSLQKILKSSYPELLDISQFSPEKSAFAMNLDFFLMSLTCNDKAMGAIVLKHLSLDDLEPLRHMFESPKEFPSNFWCTFFMEIADEKSLLGLLVEKGIIERGWSLFFGTKDKDGNTFLLEAVKTNNIPIVKRLVAAGINLNQHNHNGKTPLDIALDNNFVELAKLLAPRHKL